jgi:hypothetical protein
MRRKVNTTKMIKDELRQWVALAEQIEHMSERFQFLRIPSNEDDVSRLHRVRYALVARTASSFKVVLKLVRTRQVVEARIVARSCIENALYMNRLLKDGEDLLGIMEKSEEQARHRRGRFMLEQPRIVVDDETRERLQDFLRINRSQNSKVQMSTPKSVSKGIPFEHLYLMYSQMSDDAGHPSLTSLVRHVRIENESLVTEFNPPASVSELIDTLTWSCMAAVTCMIDATHLFEDAGLNHHANELALAYERLANPTKMTG